MRRVQGISLENIANTSYFLSRDRKGIRKLGHQPSCRNISRFSAWSSKPEDAGVNVLSLCTPFHCGVKQRLSLPGESMHKSSLSKAPEAAQVSLTSL